jgi:hypothetical protein
VAQGSEEGKGESKIFSRNFVSFVPLCEDYKKWFIASIKGEYYEKHSK